MAKWKVDKAMAAWGILFGVAATVGGILLFGAFSGGFVAQGFFLIVISWVVAFMFFAKLVTAIRERTKRRKKEYEE